MQRLFVILFLSIIFSQEEENTIFLHSGANLISFYVIPEDNTIENMLSSLGDNILMVVTSNSGSIYTNGMWMGSLQHIESDAGYWIMVENDASLILSGSPINPNNALYPERTVLQSLQHHPIDVTALHRLNKAGLKTLRSLYYLTHRLEGQGGGDDQ